MNEAEELESGDDYTNGTDSNQDEHSAPLTSAPQAGDSSSTARPTTASLLRSKTANQVANRFIVRTSSPLPDYNNEFCAAFTVDDNAAKEGEEYYALVYNKGVPIRMNAIATLTQRVFPNLQSPVAAEITTISEMGEQRIVAIFPKLQGISLRQFISANGPCSESFIIQYIITPLTALLRLMHDSNIPHGTINLDTVIIDAQGKIILTECVSQVCGYTQNFLYESLERVSVFPIGKGEGDNVIDYYALGALCLALTLGKEPVTDESTETFLESRLSRGSFNAITVGIKIPPIMEDLFKGLINDKKTECWNHTHIADWIKGKKYNIISPTSHIESSRAITFNDKEFFNCRALAYSLYISWDKAQKFLKEETLVKWIERNVQDTHKAEKLRDVLRIYSTNHGKTRMTDDDLVANSLLILDPDSVIRLKGRGTTIDGLIQIFTFGTATKKNEYIQYFLRILHLKLIDLWESGRRSDVRNKHHALALELIERAQGLMEETSMGFGIERCLYELNPTLACQSELLFGEYITTLHAMLQNLETHANDKKELFVDRHIIAFITNRLEMKSKVIIKGLSRFPQLENNADIQLLALLAISQKQTKIKQLKNLAEVMEKRLASVVNLYHSTKIREQYAESLRNVARSGDLVAMIKIVTNTSFIKKDEQGFQRAKAQYNQLDNRISQYNNKRVISNIGYRYGLQLALILAYMFCSIVVIALVVKAI
jgi:hypothetical protein